MARWLYLLTAFVALAAWAGAQGPVPSAPLSAEDKLRLLRANSTLIDNLVRDGVAMSTASDPVDRAERCRYTARTLVNAIQDAARAEDAARVAELTTLFRSVVVEGLIPTLNDAKQNVTPESPGAKKLGEVQTNSVRDVTDLKAAATTGKLADNPHVKAALKQIDELNEQLK
jgi:hypothetical protein